jgi:hypothetical protein
MRFLILSIVLVSANAFAASDPSVECGQQLAKQPQFSLIAKKVPLTSIKDMTFDMLSNDSKPTPADRTQIHDWVTAHQECIRQGDDFRKTNYPPEVAAIVGEIDNKMIGVVADLYAKKLTYGQANKQLQAIFDDFTVRLSVIVQRVQADKLAADQAQKAQQAQQAAAQAAQEQQQRDIAARAQQAELDRQAQAQQAQAQADAARRQAALQYLSSHPIVAPQATFTPLPTQTQTRTNCQTYGNQTNCTAQ